MTSKKIERLIKLAHGICQNHTGKRRHVAFIVYRNRILSVGINSYEKTDAYVYRKNYLWGYTHAESAAIKNFSGDPSLLSKCELYVIRILRDNNALGESKPCNNCQRLIDSYRFKRVFYSTEQGMMLYARHY